LWTPSQGGTGRIFLLPGDGCVRYINWAWCASAKRCVQVNAHPHKSRRRDKTVVPSTVKV